MLEKLYLAQGAALQQMQARLDELTARVVSLQEDNDRLRRRVSRNSGNSSMPPSQDGALPGAPLPAPKPGPATAKRARGRQRGAPGSALRWAEDPVIEDHLPCGPCAGCGQDLAAAVPVEVVRAAQVTDIPVVTATVTEHRIHAVVCACGRRTSAPAPAGLPDAPCSYGPNLATLVVYLLVVHALPVARAAGLIADVTGARPSTGYVHGLLRRAANTLARPIKAIAAGLRGAHAVHFDETPMRIGAAPERGYVWVACTDLLTLYYLGDRSLDTFVAFDIGAHLHGVVVHDGYTVYGCADAFDQTRILHQLCVAHLLRKLTDAAQAHPEHTWPGQAADALRALIHAHHTARDAGLPAIPTADAAAHLSAYHDAVDTGLAALPRRRGKQLPARNLLECLDTFDEDILRFTTDTRVPPTNNQGERTLRPLKTQQKISGRLTSEPTTRDRLTISAFVSTAVKHGRNAMTSLREAILGDPWIPPLTIPADP